MVAPGALDQLGGSDRPREYDDLGPLDDPGVQLSTVRLMSHGILAADMAAVKAAERAISGRSNCDRVRIIDTLGSLSAAAEEATGAALDPLVQAAVGECKVARSLVEATRRVLRTRQTNHDFVRWVAHDPDGFSRWIWSASLRATGGRVWDRSWVTIAEKVQAVGWTRICPAPPDDRRAGWRPFEESAAIARRAAIDALVERALADGSTERTTAWHDAIARAERTPGAQTWAYFANQIRSEIGTTTWAMTNQSVAYRVAEVVDDIPRIAGFSAMIALAIEASTSPVRAAVVTVGAKALRRHRDIETALDAAACETRRRVPVGV